MAGHSQFANIKHRKGAQDSKRSQKFTKLIREIVVAAKQGLPNPELNPRLRSAIFAARKENLPKDKIEMAIKNATSNIAGENYEEIQYEGHGPLGAAFIVHAVTNNRNRTASELRYIFSRNNGNLGETGSVSYMFDHVGTVIYKAENINFNDFFNYAVEFDVINVEENDLDKVYIVTSTTKDFGKVRNALYERFGEPELARLSWQAKDPVQISDKDAAEKILNLIEALEDNSDVQYTESNVLLLP
ncbi:YebC/PmpR family DNA-binding transcriptional regulator [Wolbachia endosymbiont of Pentidionis agamae]|uniref:YebC/PmpR family DNA-binding transcriptional regulator n=1 Tax=Wolbachia endosymbiont of Pentidionis agamae TaxID=3110435 RepID=UPI002FD115AC